jgi:DNA-binding transcriptional ArsR family regulator
MDKIEKIFKAFANRRRIAILRFLRDGRAATVGEIAGEIGLSFTATSKHLNILFNADILEREQKGLQIFYYIAKQPSKAVNGLLSLI